MNDNTEQDPPMSLIAHLTELRDRLLRAVWPIVDRVCRAIPFCQRDLWFCVGTTARTDARGFNHDRHRSGIALSHPV